MAIQRFYEVDNLIGYWCPVETGGALDDVTEEIDRLDSLVTDTTEEEPAYYVTEYYPEDEKIQFDPSVPSVYQIGNLPAVYHGPGMLSAYTSMNPHYLLSDAEGPLSYVAVIEPFDINTEGWYFNGRDTNNANNFIALYINNGRVYCKYQNSTMNVGACPAGPVVVVYRYDRYNTQVIDVFINGVLSNSGSKGTESLHNLSYLTLFNQSTTHTTSMNGKLGLLAMYNKFLTDTEVQDLTDLANYYITNGGPYPEEEYPTTGYFDADTNDPSATITWTVQRAQDVEFVPISNLSNVVIENTPAGLTGGRLRIVSAVPADAGVVRCTSTTSYDIKHVDVELQVVN